MISIQINRSMSSTILSDARKKKVEVKKDLNIEQINSIVQVGKIGIANKTTVGNAHEYTDSSDHKVNSVHSETTSEQNLDSSNSIVETGVSESHILSKRITGTIGKAAGITIIGSMIAGPPVIGYLLFDLVGLAVGSMISGPFVMIFVWALVA